MKCFQEKYKEINNPYIYTVKYYVFEHCLIYIKTDKHNNFLFGKYENFKDLKTVYLRGAPLNTRKRLVETIEKLKKCKADSLLRFELLKTKDVKEILTKIYEFNCLT